MRDIGDLHRFIYARAKLIPAQPLETKRRKDVFIDAKRLKQIERLKDKTDFFVAIRGAFDIGELGNVCAVN